jgi:hypothetical protein
MIDDETFTAYYYIGKEESVVIPKYPLVTVLYDKLFRGHSEIKQIVIPDTVTDIGGFVFDGCINLKEIILPPSLQNMWQYAMTRSGIEKIEIPKNNITNYTVYLL